MFVLVEILQLDIWEFKQWIGLDDAIAQPDLLLYFSPLLVQQGHFLHQVDVGRLESG